MDAQKALKQAAAYLRGRGHSEAAEDLEARFLGRPRRPPRRLGRGPTYDDLPQEMKDAIKDYVAFTNELLRAAVKEYFRDTAAAERRHGKMGTWDVSRVTDMSMLFDHRSSFDADLGAWDTSSVSDMLSMFESCRQFSGRGIGAWDTSSVTTMSHMFDYCHRFRGEGIGAWDTSSVTTMSSMFYGARLFTADISRWNVSSVTDHRNMFDFTKFPTPFRPTFPN